MRPVMRVFLYDEEGNKFFGEGPCRLLHGVEKTGSLRAAAADMGLAYSKALMMIRRAEGVLGFSLTETTIGGKGGGGSRLTQEGKKFLQQYETYRDTCYQAGDRIYREVFPE